MKHTPRTSRRLLWAGRVASGLAILFLAVDVLMKLARVPEAVQGTAALGYPEHAVATVGLLGAACLVLYVIPRTAILGAVLWTGYLGGAVASHVRLDNPLVSHTLFPIYVAALLWGGLAVRDARVRALVMPRLRTMDA